MAPRTSCPPVPSAPRSSSRRTRLPGHDEAPASRGTPAPAADLRSRAKKEQLHHPERSRGSPPPLRASAPADRPYGRLSAANIRISRQPPGSKPSMLGRDHALTGAFVFAALGPTLHVTGAHLAAGVALTAGAGVLPDIDHPDSTISRSFGFLTEAFAWLVDRLSGGHRRGTHSLFGIAVFTAGAVSVGAYP